MSALSTSHAPVLTRHGWIERRYLATATTRGPAPEGCPAVATHKDWHYGFKKGRTLILDASVCDHDARAVRECADAQGMLW